MLRSNVIKACNLDIVCLCERMNKLLIFLVIRGLVTTVSQYLNEHPGVLVGYRNSD